MSIIYLLAYFSYYLDIYLLLLANYFKRSAITLKLTKCQSLSYAFSQL